MATYIEKIRINSFRGIKELAIKGLKDVNIIAGDNNSGKTSILEAIALLRNPYSFYNVLKTARMREGVLIRSTPYESFMSMFPKDDMTIDIEAIERNDYLELQIHGEEQNRIISAEAPVTYNPKKKDQKFENKEIRCFVGKMYGVDRGKPKVTPIDFPYISGLNEYSATPNKRNIVYVPPGSHLQGNVFNKIVRNDQYKAICIRLLQLFDEGIIDLLYLNNEKTLRAVEYVKHKDLGLMPLSSYGDGIKRVLSLANSIAEAADGILMIDEIETSISYKYYHDIFGFLIKACRQYGVQMFITTHNIEAIDAILEAQNYQNDLNYDSISVLTFRKDTKTGKVRSRQLSGREVFESREKFAFEVRL